MTTLLPIALGLLLQSTLLILLGLVAMRLARRHGPTVQSLIGRTTLAGVALALLLAAPLAGHIRPLWRVTLPAASIPPAPISVDGMGEDRPSTPNSGVARNRWALPAVPSAPPATPSAPLSSPTPPEWGAGGRSLPPIPQIDPKPTPRPSLLRQTYPTLAAAWGLGTALLLLWLGVCQYYLTRLRRRACPVTAGLTTEMLAGLTPRPPALLTHPSVRSPFLAGLRRPAIFLPNGYEAEFDPTALRAILAHELAHLARRDNAWVLAARLLTALLWHQPLLWVLCRRLEQTGEEACDQAVLAQDCLPRAYADCLLTLAERHPLGRRERALGVGVAPFRSSLGRRIGRILDKGTHAMSAVTLRLRLTAAALAVAAALGGVFLVSSAPAQSPGPATGAMSPGRTGNTTALTSEQLTKYLATLTPQQRQLRATTMQDMSNLKQIGIALSQYAQDHDEHFPNAAHWMEALSPYLKDKTVFFDPFQPGAKRYGYAFNRNCSGKSLAFFDYPSAEVMAFDSTLGTRDASDTGQSVRYTAHNGDRYSSILFVDAHVKWMRASYLPSFAIQHSARPSYRPRRMGQSQAPPVFSQALVQSAREIMFAQRASHPDPELSNARFLAGLTPVQGPGVVVTLRDGKKSFPAMPNGVAPPSIIHDTDINQVVNELKAAGAEAIAVNDQRLVATSSVRSAGPTILINFTPTVPPYIIKAIGAPKALASAMNLPGGVASQIKAFDPAMFSVREANTLKLPAYTGASAPHYARPAGLTNDSVPVLRGADISIAKPRPADRLMGLIKQNGIKLASQPPIILADYAPKTIPDPAELTGNHASAHMTDFHSYLNMKQIALAVWQYAYNHKDRFPDADRWMDEIKPYLKSEDYYHDPAAPASERYSYAYNRSLSGAADDRVSNMSETVMLFESSLDVRNASDTGQSLIKPARHQGQWDFVFVNIGGPGRNSHPSFALHIAPPDFFAKASPDQLARLQKRTQAQLVSGQVSLAAADQQFEGELRRALPQADTSRLAQARMLEMKIGLQVMGLQNVRKFPQSETASRHAEAWTQSQLRPLLAQEARLLPDMPGPQRARLHSAAASLTNLQFNVEGLREEDKQFSRERQRRR